MMKSRISILLLLLVMIISCQHDDWQTLEGNVYVGGAVIVHNHYVPVYWKGNQITFLGDTSHTGMVDDIAVVNGKVYAAGTVSNRAVYWEDGNEVQLSANETGIDAIFVAGANVYSVGYKSTANGNQAMLWINSAATELLPQYERSFTNDILVDGNDVYIAGHASDSRDRRHAFLMKNNVIQFLDTTAAWTDAYSIQLSNGDVYVSGLYQTGPNSSYYETAGNGTLVYWKNGKRVAESAESVSVIDIRKIIVDKGVVHQCGSKTLNGAYNNATYWADGSARILSHEPNSVGEDMVLQNGTPLIAGVIGGRGVVWKNFAPIDLWNQSSYSFASSIAIDQ